MKMTRDTNDDISISNPALITTLLAANGVNDCNPHRHHIKTAKTRPRQLTLTC
jgi:hypothetical protein